MSPEEVMALGGFSMPETDYGETAGVLNMRDPRSQIGGTGASGINPQSVMSMPEGPEKDAMRRRLQRMQGEVDLPGFMRGV